MLNQSNLSEFYEHVFPVELLVSWMSYNFSEKEVSEEARIAASQRSDGRLVRREFCFTLIGDIFTRFRSYGSTTELRAELVRSFPEKVDIGAVYDAKPNQRRISAIQPVERELVFDIDMSDYDNCRSCCSGKSICGLCWQWMACAAEVLQYLLYEDFGFRYILPVFSGRRGIHLWVCDARARIMGDDERAALVAYLSIVNPKTLRSSVIVDLANHKPIHPSLRRVSSFLDRAFSEIFMSSADSPNNIESNPAAAAIVHDCFLSVLKQGRADLRNAFVAKCGYEQGGTIRWDTYRLSLGENLQSARDVLFAAQLMLLYPRLDEHVSTRRDHLLKLPFCVHPATGSLCCPLEWDSLAHFNPTAAPQLEDILLERRIDEQWVAPLTKLLRDMAEDPKELC